MTCFVYKMYKINSKILFFLADILFLGWGGAILDFDKYIVPWRTSLFGGLTSIRVIWNSGKYGICNY